MYYPLSENESYLHSTTCPGKTEAAACTLQRHFLIIYSQVCNSWFKKQKPANYLNSCPLLKADHLLNCTLTFPSLSHVKKAGNGLCSLPSGLASSAPLRREEHEAVEGGLTAHRTSRGSASTRHFGSAKPLADTHCNNRINKVLQTFPYSQFKNGKNPPHETRKNPNSEMGHTWPREQRKTVQRSMLSDQQGTAHAVQAALSAGWSPHSKPCFPPPSDPRTDELNATSELFVTSNSVRAFVCHLVSLPSLSEGFNCNQNPIIRYLPDRLLYLGTSKILYHSREDQKTKILLKEGPHTPLLETSN